MKTTFDQTFYRLEIPREFSVLGFISLIDLLFHSEDSSLSRFSSLSIFEVSAISALSALSALSAISVVSVISATAAVSVVSTKQFQHLVSGISEVSVK